MSRPRVSGPLSPQERAAADDLVHLVGLRDRAALAPGLVDAIVTGAVARSSALRRRRVARRAGEGLAVLAVASVAVAALAGIRPYGGSTDVTQAGRSATATGESSVLRADGAGPRVNLQRGAQAAEGYDYAVSLYGFPAGAAVVITCHDSASPGGFARATVRVDPDGQWSGSHVCSSGRGPSHWVTAGIARSEDLEWDGLTAPGVVQPV